MTIGDILVNWTKIQLAAMGTIWVQGTRYFGYKLVSILSCFGQNQLYLPNPGGAESAPLIHNSNYQTTPFIGLMAEGK